MLKAAFVIGTGIVIAVALALLGSIRNAESETVQATGGTGPGVMALAVNSGSAGGTCDSDLQATAPSFIEQCVIPKGDSFTLSVDLRVVPEGGYSAFQTEVVWTGVPSKDQLSFVDEEMVFPGIGGLQTPPGPNAIYHAGLPNCCPPVPTEYKGKLVELTFSCEPATGPKKPESIRFDLVPYDVGNNLGSGLLVGSPIVAVPAVSLTIACAGDADDDGCPDYREIGNDPQLGGQRDYQNPWDYYDVETFSGPGQDGRIDLLFDLLSVVNHYAPSGQAPYDASYDRGPSTGPNPWNMTAPDGVIDLLNDILGAVRQVNHNCT